MTTLLIATRNRHKVAELRAILGARFRLLALNDFPEAPNLKEDAGTFAANATQKAVQLAKWVARAGSSVSEAPNPLPHALGQGSERCKAEPMYVLADDSGLEVDALNGAPGVHSARYAALGSAQAGNSPDSENNAKLLRALKDVPPEKRTGRFRCVLALTPITGVEPANSSPVCYADELELKTEIFEGTCEGRIGFAPRGTNGFGYDPLFVPDGHAQTFAELGDEVKNKLSHRAQALKALKARLSA